MLWQPVVTSDMAFMNIERLPVPTIHSRADDIAEKVSTHPQTESIALLPAATDEINASVFFMLSGAQKFFGFSFPVKRANKPITKEATRLDKNIRTPLLVFPNIKVPIAVMVKDGDGLTHQYRRRCESSFDIIFIS